MIKLHHDRICGFAASGIAIVAAILLMAYKQLKHFSLSNNLIWYSRTFAGRFCLYVICTIRCIFIKGA
ncbi:hypothetical protein LRS37_11145 [Neobacillus sedimentimangrovi]|uniref:Uncharacterized protein n=1 Tax=Neobacillus sedimentimangrovi TaxID=2699460 RepID=A0ABS8QJJ9_9BACI|nr:hypothetical protein [Neobacillus sedimentimangrovi]AIM17004.1 hypothetical protein HW35_12775 [Bacillus sp. X1(2014)]MCD4839426.1 hypothetical protein [Neobacillus sedimentimangrovi]